MWKRAVRWVYQVWPDDPEAQPVRETEQVKERESSLTGTRGGDD
jgi:hypothetical protein